jgi:hypothetical protein
MAASGGGGVRPLTYGLCKGGKHNVETPPPKQMTFLISLGLFLIAAIIHYGHVAIPYAHNGFTIRLIGYLVLLAGNLLEGV